MNGGKKMSIYSLPDTRPFYNGEHQKPLDSGAFITINPATEVEIASVPESGENDVNAVVEAAQKAFDEWKNMEAYERGRAVTNIAEAIENNSEELAFLDVLDSGKTIEDAREDTHAASKMFRYFGGLVDKIEGTIIPAENEKLCYTTREPYGVIGAITAWNYPLFNSSAKIAPIIATGNACILKPSEDTPLTALRLAEIIANVNGVPKGLVSVVNGPGEKTGALIVSHPGVNRITFTGSTVTGQTIMKNISESTMKGITLELGGKAPVIVFPDANIDGAAKAISFSAFYNQGQTCTAATRVIVHKDIHKELLTKVCEIAERIVVGDPTDEETLVGPIISRVQYEKVLGYIERAISSGIHPVIGGYRPENLERGFFLSPTVFDNILPENELFQDELFGPVLTFTEFDTEDDAVALANNSDYGLAAGLWTSNVQRMHLLAKRIKCGIIWGNTLFAEFPGSPAGGFKNSGFGREFGKESIAEYTQQKTTWVSLDDGFFEWA
jgi:acyl-CoA reductase-like NAD-dependent aldehyde dehydrogenase